MATLKRAHTTAAAIAAVFFFSAYTMESGAQASVRDSSPVAATPGAATVLPAAAVSAASSAVAPQPLVEPQSASYNLAYQLQQLQQEVLALRGLVEEQGFELKRLKQQRLDDYLDLDKRIGQLGSQAGSTKDHLATRTVDSASSTAANNGEAEKQLYRDAIDQLLKKQDYQGAKSRFNQYLRDYPQGIYVPNVYYWQGQIYLTEGDKAAAEKAFKSLVDKHADHPKNPDAKYKLATIYFEQGKKAEAKTLLDDVVASNSDSSRLAKAFLASQYQ